MRLMILLSSQAPFGTNDLGRMFCLACQTQRVACMQKSATQVEIATKGCDRQ